MVGAAAHALSEAEHALSALKAQRARHASLSLVVASPLLPVASPAEAKEERVSTLAWEAAQARAVEAVRVARARYNACRREVGNPAERLALARIEIARLEGCADRVDGVVAATAEALAAAEISATAMLRSTEVAGRERAARVRAEAVCASLHARVERARRANAAPLALRVDAADAHAALSGTYLMVSTHRDWPVYRRCDRAAHAGSGGTSALGVEQFIFRAGEWAECWVVGDVIGSDDGWLRSDGGKESPASAELSWFASRADGAAWERCGTFRVEAATVEATTAALRCVGAKTRGSPTRGSPT